MVSEKIYSAKGQNRWGAPQHHCVVHPLHPSSCLRTCRHGQRHTISLLKLTAHCNVFIVQPATSVWNFRALSAGRNLWLSFFNGKENHPVVRKRRRVVNVIALRLIVLSCLAAFHAHFYLHCLCFNLWTAERVSKKACTLDAFFHVHLAWIHVTCGASNRHSLLPRI